MRQPDGVERLSLYLDWLRRKLPGWKFYAECNEGEMGWIAVQPADPAMPAREFFFRPNQESDGMANLHIWLMDQFRHGKLGVTSWDEQAK